MSEKIENFPGLKQAKKQIITISAAESDKLYKLALLMRHKYDHNKAEYYREIIRELKGENFFNSLSHSEFNEFRGIIKSRLDNILDLTGSSPSARLAGQIQDAENVGRLRGDNFIAEKADDNKDEDK